MLFLSMLLPLPTLMSPSVVARVVMVLLLLDMVLTTLGWVFRLLRWLMTLSAGVSLLADPLPELGTRIPT